jgi:hypothetical protein
VLPGFQCCTFMAGSLGLRDARRVTVAKLGYGCDCRRSDARLGGHRVVAISNLRDRAPLAPSAAGLNLNRRVVVSDLTGIEFDAAAATGVPLRLGGQVAGTVLKDVDDAEARMAPHVLRLRRHVEVANLLDESVATNLELVSVLNL